MVKVAIDNSKGLVQRQGSGVEFSNNVTWKPGANQSGGIVNSYGIHQISAEINIGGLSFTATDNGLIRTILTVPANSRVLRASIICTETVAGAAPTETALADICFTADAITGTDQVITSTGDIYADLDLKSNSLGTAGTFNTPGWVDATIDGDYVVDSGATGVRVVLINRSTGNGTTLKTAGKFLVTVEYLGAGPASLLTTV